MRQRNKYQMSKLEKSPEKINEMKASKLLDTEFKTMAKRILKEVS